MWQYYRDDPNNNIAESESFNFKINIKGKTPGADNKKSVEIAVSLKYLSNFWRTLEISLINRETNLILTWSENCVIFSTAGKTKFKITDTKLFVPVATLSIQDNAKLFEQFKSGFKRTTNWNKYQPKFSPERKSQYSDFLTDPSFQGVNNVLLFENEDDRTVSAKYYLPTVEINDYNVMIDGKKLF